MMALMLDYQCVSKRMITEKIHSRTCSGESLRFLFFSLFLHMHIEIVFFLYLMVGVV
jgi:hypothetical protein